SSARSRSSSTAATWSTDTARGTARAPGNRRTQPTAVRRAGSGPFFLSANREDQDMAWMWLLAAGLLEIVWAWGLKASEGFTRPRPIVVTVLGTIASFWCLARALREIPLGTGYAVWVGIGAVGTALLGMVLYH